MILAVGLAVGAAALFGTGTALQSHAASPQRRFRDSQGWRPVRAIRRTMTRPLWLTGILLDWGGTASHIAALRYGSLSLVQPLALSAVVFAVPAEALCRRERPSGAHLWAAAQAAVGLGGLVVLLHGHEYPGGLLPAWITWGLVAMVMLALVLSAARARTDRFQALLLGAAAGSFFGAAAALVRNLQMTFTGVTDPASAAGVVGVLITSAAGLLLSQSALHRGHLAWSLPAQDVLALAVSIGIGAARFGDISHQSWISAILIGLALALTTSGILRLSRTEQSPSGNGQSAVESSL